jgi:hypothetical protein
MVEGLWRDGDIGFDGDKSFKIIYPDSSVYFGELKGDDKHGIGREIGANGRVFQGTYHEGGVASQSSAYVIYPDSSTYQGEVLDGKSHGQGKNVLADGTTLIGEWENNVFINNGYCHVIYPCDREYIGYMSDDIWNGRGALRSLGGTAPSVKKCVWKDGQLSGKSRLRYPDGTTYCGLFQDGEPIERGRVTWFDGRKGEGEIDEKQLLFFPQPIPSEEKTS